MKIVSKEQMSQLEEQSASVGITNDVLMERAGLSAAKKLRTYVERLAGLNVAVIIGPGSNGGDGLVLARYIHRWGGNVIAYFTSPRKPGDPQLNKLRKYGVSVIYASDDPHLSTLENILENSKVVVDAVFGTGYSRPLDGRFLEVVKRLENMKYADSDTLLISLDMPSGMNADTGEIDTVCPYADLTISFGFAKRGHFLFPGAERTGQLSIVDIGIPDEFSIGINVNLLNRNYVEGMMPTRHQNVHKGSFDALKPAC